MDGSYVDKELELLEKIADLRVMIEEKIRKKSKSNRCRSRRKIET